jgi:hypothetical protein
MNLNKAPFVLLFLSLLLAMISCCANNKPIIRGTGSAPVLHDLICPGGLTAGYHGKFILKYEDADGDLAYFEAQMVYEGHKGKKVIYRGIFSDKGEREFKFRYYKMSVPRNILLNVKAFDLQNNESNTISCRPASF